MARIFKGNINNEFRLCCPECESSWTTWEVPSYCPNEDCGALVTFRTIKYTARDIRRADGEAKKLHRALHRRT
jgi:hypothetical protein